MLIFNRETNKGKTYITQKEDSDNLYTEKANAFNTWFELHSTELELYLKDRNSFDGSRFTETYLKVYENTLHRGTEIGNGMGFFLSAYFRIAMNDIKFESRYQDLPSYVEHESIDDVELHELQEINDIQVKQIFEYVYSRYSLKDYEIFKMYINLQPAISYHSLAKITGLKYWYVQRVISKVINDLKENRAKIESRQVYNMETNTEKIELTETYNFSTDYDTLWDIRLQSSYTVICTVNINEIEYIANMTPNGEIFDSGNCYSDFEGVSKTEFLRKCDSLKVKYIMPYELDKKTKKKTKRTKSDEQIDI